MSFRIQKRKGSSDIIEMKTTTEEGKEKWIPCVAPLLRKSEGDILCKLILNYLNEEDSR